MWRHTINQTEIPQSSIIIQQKGIPIRSLAKKDIRIPILTNTDRSDLE